MRRQLAVLEMVFITKYFIESEYLLEKYWDYLVQVYLTEMDKYIISNENIIKRLAKSNKYKLLITSESPAACLVKITDRAHLNRNEEIRVFYVYPMILAAASFPDLAKFL